MLWTRVGYAGGRKDRPTYRDLGDHSEAIEIGFDPSRISYEQLLAEFWDAHSPEGEAWSRQYRNAVFVHGEAQREAAERTRRQVQRELGQPVHTAIEDAGTFWQAEDYHQKYSLQRYKQLFSEVSAVYPATDDLVRSTLAARLNAWVAGWGEAGAIERELDALGLSADGRRVLLDAAR